MFYFSYVSEVGRYFLQFVVRVSGMAPLMRAWPKGTFPRQPRQGQEATNPEDPDPGMSLTAAVSAIYCPDSLEESSAKAAAEQTAEQDKKKRKRNRYKQKHCLFCRCFSQESDEVDSLKSMEWEYPRVEEGVEGKRCKYCKRTCCVAEPYCDLDEQGMVKLLGDYAELSAWKQMRDGLFKS